MNQEIYTATADQRLRNLIRKYSILAQKTKLPEQDDDGKFLRRHEQNEKSNNRIFQTTVFARL